MNKLLLILFLLISQLAFGQLIIIHNSNGSVDWHFPTEAEAEAFKQKILFQDKDLQTKDSLIKEVYKPTIEIQKLRIDTLHYAISKYKDIVKRDSVQNAYILGEYINENTKSKPLIEWLGFYAGAGTGYYLSDTLLKSTIGNSLFDNIFISGTGYLRISNFMLSGEMRVPLKGTAGINLKLEFKL
jgi:hypothetical protein